ncbi:MAG: YdcF family protein [Pseudomonadota bacterium]
MKVAIIFGAGIDPDRVLGYHSRMRVRAGVDLLKNGMADTLILSGGKLRGRNIIIGEKMRDYAINLGANPADMIVEGKARTTFENIRFSMPLTTARGTEIALVTSDFHLTRTAYLADYLGLSGTRLVASGDMTWWRARKGLFNIARESLAWWYNIGKVALWWALSTAGMDEADRGQFVY